MEKQILENIATKTINSIDRKKLKKKFKIHQLTYLVADVGTIFIFFVHYLEIVMNCRLTV